VKTVNLEEIAKSPAWLQEASLHDVITEHECLTLKEIKKKLLDKPLEEVTSMVEENPHLVLWTIIAERSLLDLNWVIAEKALVRCQDYPGLKFMRRIKNLDDKGKQKAEVLIW